MKTLTLTMLALVMVMSSHTSLTSRSSVSGTDVSQATAIVERLDGFYLFMLCKPTTEYEYLGTVKKHLAWSGKPKEMLWAMIRKVKKDYPGANGIIFSTIDMGVAEAIRFK